LSESRGAEATGICYNKQNKIVIAKDPISASVFLKEMMPKHTPAIEKTHVALGHTRYPTIGSPKDNNNNHPIESQNWILIHNGSVTSMPRIKDYPYKGQVDTEVLSSYIETYGLEKGLPYVERGSAAVAVMNKKDPSSIYLWREASPIVLAYNETSSTLFFASQRDFLERSLVNLIGFFSSFIIRELPANQLIHITTNPVSIKHIGYIEVMKWNHNVHNTCIAKDTTKINYKNNKDLVFNVVTKRWELPDTKTNVVNIDSIKVDPPLLPVHTEIQTNILLKKLGFSEIEINRMTFATKTTILYNNYTPEEIYIDSDGNIKKYLNVSNTAATAISEDLSNKYYIGVSHDYKSWIKLEAPNKGHISIDSNLIKKWDTTKKSHFIMTVDDAVKENLIDEKELWREECNILEQALENMPGLEE